MHKRIFSFVFSAGFMYSGFASRLVSYEDKQDTACFWAAEI
jgi:hypothetical protein